MQELLPDYVEDLHSHGKSPGTIATYRQRIQAFLGWAGDRPITRRLLIDYKEYLQLERRGKDGEGCRPRTIRTHLAALSSFWKFAETRGFRDLPKVSEVPKPRLDKERSTWVSPKQAPLLVAAAGKVGHSAAEGDYRDYLRWRAEVVITLGLMLGLRRCDMRALRKADLIQRDGRCQLRIRKSKGGETRTIPVPDFAREKLESWLAVRDARCKRLNTDPPNMLIDRYGKPIGNLSLDTAMRQVTALAGLADERITPHSLRHGCATYLLRLGVDPETVRQILGHANVSTTWKYVHTDQGAAQSAMDRLGEALGGKPVGKNAPPSRRPTRSQNRRRRSTR